MTKLYFVRHAEAEGNLYRRAHGQTDGRLTPAGRAQLAPLAARFAKIPLDAVYSSDLTRAYETARAIAGAQGLTVTARRGLREICLGDWEDRPWGELAHAGDEGYLRFARGELDFFVSGGENGLAVRERLTREAAEIARAHEGGTVAVASHGAALQYFLSQFGAMRHWGLDNTSVSLCEYENGAFSLVYAGDNSHVGDLSTHARLKVERGGALVSRAELWFRPVRLPDEEAELAAAGLEAWKAVYGTEREFDRAYFLHICAEAAWANPRYVQFAMNGERPSGLLQLRDAGRISEDDGHIALLYLEEELRGHGVGVQLLGEAVSVYRAAGRGYLTLRVWEGNLRARVFYNKHGFAEIGREPGYFGELIIMRREI